MWVLLTDGLTTGEVASELGLAPDVVIDTMARLPTPALPAAAHDGPGPGRVAKRAVDLVGALVGLVLFGPLLALAAWAAVRQQGRPALHKSVRAGRGEQPFTLLKLRTMSDARDTDGQLLPDGERLTSVGRRLRSTSIDELPQLWNVLRGDMSLVGPRPLPTAYLPRYTAEERRRHDVRPGLTGWAQVNGRNAAGLGRAPGAGRLVRRPPEPLARRADPRPHRAGRRPPPGHQRRRGGDDGRAAAGSLRRHRRGHRMSRIYLSPPDVRGTEREHLLAALDSGWVAPAGPDLTAFEDELAERPAPRTRWR